MKAPHVAVVGAGMAGLAAAHYLSQIGVRCTVLEAAPVLGGRAAMLRTASFTHRGRRHSFPIEHGLHGIFAGYQNLRALLQGITDLSTWPSPPQQELVMEAPKGFVRAEFGARIRDSSLPTSLAMFGYMGDAEMRAAMARERPQALVEGVRGVLRCLAHHPTQDGFALDHIPASRWIDTWPGVQRKFFTTMVRSASFAEPEDVGLGSFLEGMRVYGMGRKDYSGFQVCPTDIGTDLLKPLAASVGQQGAVHLNRPATGLELREDHVQIQTPQGPVRSDAVVLALDTPAAARLCPTGPLALPPASAPLGYPSCVLRLWFDAPASGRTPPLASSGLLADGPADAFFWLHHLQTPFKEWERATGGSVLELHRYSRRAQAWADLSTDEVLTQILPALKQIWPEVGPLVHADLQRNPWHVAFGPGMLQMAPTVQTPHPRVARAGDWIRTPQPGVFHLERATLTALLAARHLAPALGLSPEVLPTPKLTLQDGWSVRGTRRVIRAARRGATWVGRRT